MTHVDFVCAADIGWLRLHLVDLVFGHLGTMVPKKNTLRFLWEHNVGQAPSSDLLISFHQRSEINHVSICLMFEVTCLNLPSHLFFSVSCLNLGSHWPSSEVYTARHSLGTGSGSPIDLEGSRSHLHRAGRFFLAACCHGGFLADPQELDDLDWKFWWFP